MTRWHIPAGKRRTAFVVLALLALLLAQGIAQAHPLRHLTGAPESPLLPGQHAPICTDCVSHAPMLAMAACVAVALAFAFPGSGASLPATGPVAATGPFRHAFRSRAPPAPR
jgi:hypothetical protein